MMKSTKLSPLFIEAQEWHWKSALEAVDICIGMKLGTLQKQVGCLNHKAVTLVADKLRRLWI